MPKTTNLLTLGHMCYQARRMQDEAREHFAACPCGTTMLAWTRMKTHATKVDGVFKRAVLRALKPKAPGKRKK